MSLNSQEPSRQMPRKNPRRVFRKIRKGQVVLLVYFILLFPAWIWPFGGSIGSFFQKEISPEMSPQERSQVRGRNAFVILVFDIPHPFNYEIYYISIGSYRDAGRPDLARRVEVIGGILLSWKAASFLGLFLFPILLIKLIKCRELALVLIVAVLLDAFLILYSILFLR